MVFSLNDRANKHLILKMLSKIGEPKFVVVVTCPLPRDAGVAEDHGVKKLSTALTRNRKERKMFRSAA